MSGRVQKGQETGARSYQQNVNSLEFEEILVSTSEFPLDGNRILK